jgi:hypothetical protein
MVPAVVVERAQSTRTNGSPASSVKVVVTSWPSPLGGPPLRTST